MAILPAFQWGQGGEALSPAQAKARRDVAAAIMARRKPATTIGEGIASFGDAILYNQNMRRAAEAEEAGRTSAQEAFAALTGGGDPYAAMGNEWLMDNPAMSTVAQALLERQLRQEDPDYQLGLDLKRAQLAAAEQEMNSPLIVNDQIIDRGSYDVLGDFRTPAAPKAPDLPSGYQADPEDPTRIMPIPGGPEDNSAKEAAAEKQGAANLEAAQRAVTAAISQTNMFTAGNVMGRSGFIPIVGQGAADLGATIDTIKAFLSFEQLQAMREASPTGGALGNVTEKELALLGSTVASLDQSQSPQQLAINLAYINSVLKKATPLPPADENGVIRIDDNTTIKVIE